MLSDSVGVVGVGIAEEIGRLDDTKRGILRESSIPSLRGDTQFNALSTLASQTINEVQQRIRRIQTSFLSCGASPASSGNQPN
jgi:hypothetical protein